MPSPNRTLTTRRPLFSGEFRKEHPMARAFHAPQRERPAPGKPNKPAVFPKPKPRTYRASRDNPMNRKPVSTTRRVMVLVERSEPMVPSVTRFRRKARSRRVRRNVWVSA